MNPNQDPLNLFINSAAKTPFEPLREIAIELGRSELLLDEISNLGPGSVVSLNQFAGDPVDLVDNGRLIARGDLVIIEGKFGVRLSEVL